MAQSQAPPSGGKPSPPSIVASIAAAASVRFQAPRSPRAQRPPPVEDYSKTPCAQWTPCIDAILHAARSGARLYLALLPADLRPLIDGMVRRSAWVHSGMLAPLEHPPSSEQMREALSATEYHYFVLRSGERLWVFAERDYPRWVRRHDQLS